MGEQTLDLRSPESCCHGAVVFRIGTSQFRQGKGTYWLERASTVLSGGYGTDNRELCFSCVPSCPALTFREPQGKTYEISSPIETSETSNLVANEGITSIQKMSLLSCTDNPVNQLLRQSKTQQTFVFVDMKYAFWGNLLFCKNKDLCFGTASCGLFSPHRFLRIPEPGGHCSHKHSPSRLFSMCPS